MTLLPWPYADGAYAKVVMAPTPPTTGTVIMLTPGRGALFPDPTTTGNYVVSIWPDNQVYLGGNITDHGELALVIGRTGDSLSLARAVQGSTVRNIVAGDQVALAPTAQTHTDHMKWLTGAAGGQVFRGGTGAGEDLTLWSTGHANKGRVRIGSSGTLTWDESVQQLYLDRNYNGSPFNHSPFYIMERGTSDPAISFFTYGVNIWEIGIDNSDDDAFKINMTTAAADFTEVGIRIDRSGAVLIKGPPGAGGPDMVQIGQDAANSYARLRLEGRYHGASGAGIYDIEALDDRIYIFDRTNGMFLMSWAVGGLVAITGGLNVGGAVVIGGTVGVAGSLSTNGNITSNTRIGVGVVPAYGLDVELGSGATYAKFGASLPVYIIAANPNLGLNAYYSGGWVYGKGSTAHYGAVLTLDPLSGIVMLGVSTVPGAANTPAAISYPFLVTPTTVRLPGLPSQPVLGTDASGTIVPGTGGTGGSFNSFADVIDHGAVGNGSTNDAAAIAACDAIGIGIIFRGAHTYRISSNLNIVSECIFGQGAKLLVDSGVTLNMYGHIFAPNDQIFDWSGSAVIAFGSLRVVDFIPITWFGAGLGHAGDDGARINAACRAAAAGGMGILYQGSSIITTGIVQNGIPSKVAAGAGIGSTTPGIVAITLLGFGLTFELPSLTGPNYNDLSGSVAVKIDGCNACRIEGSIINAWSCGVYVTFNGSGATVLNNDIYFHMITAVQDGFDLVKGSGVTMQGNEFYVNFLVNVTRYCILHYNDPGDSNRFVFDTIDVGAVTPGTHPGVQVLMNLGASYIANSTFEVTSWFGGFDTDTSIWDSVFLNCSFYFPNHNLNATRYPTNFSGQNNTVRLQESGQARTNAGFAVELATASNSIASWNGGNPLYQNSIFIKHTVPGGGWATNASKTLYAYSPLCDSASLYYQLRSFTGGARIGVDFVTGTPNLYEIQLGLVNLGPLIPAGTVIYWTLGVGRD